VKIPQQLIDEVVAHAREDMPNECCGLIGGRDGTAETVHRVPNAARSPLRFEMDPQGQYDAWKAIEDAGQEFLAIYHSHTKTAAYPSQTDVNESVAWPEQMYIIVSLADPDAPDVRGYWLKDQEIADAELDIS
jgi:proteasome lid subunit RPN8/RPN11